MLNIIKSDVYRLSKGKKIPLYLLLIFNHWLFSDFWTAFSVSETPLYKLRMKGHCVLYIFMILVVNSIFTADIRNRTVKNTLSSVSDRSTYFFAKFMHIQIIAILTVTVCDFLLFLTYFDSRYRYSDHDYGRDTAAAIGEAVFINFLHITIISAVAAFLFFMAVSFAKWDVLRPLSILAFLFFVPVLGYAFSITSVTPFSFISIGISVLCILITFTLTKSGHKIFVKTEF